MTTELRCVLCGKRGGQEEELTMADFVVDPRSAVMVCRDCYTPPERNKREELRQKGGEKAITQGIAIKAAQERKAAWEAKNRGRR
jgi:hypothetical protein